jgi:aminopeptidase N
MRRNLSMPCLNLRNGSNSAVRVIQSCANRLTALLVGMLVCGLAAPVHAQSMRGLGAVAVSIDHQAEVLSHDMEVALDPEGHRLHMIDRITCKALTSSLSSLTFVLKQTMQVSTVRIGKTSDNSLPSVTVSNISTDHESDVQRVQVNFDHSLALGQVLTLEWQYEGIINDPPREPRHLRFVTPSETAGHIGPEGVYLSGETHWYPDMPGALPTFRVRVVTPKTWLAVTHGQQQSQAIHGEKMVAEWKIGSRTEALTLVANRFVKMRQDWRGIEIATYLFPEDAQLAQEYLDASVRYLETYTRLLGPYPFPKFAVVENFFASGLGMPSFTLLGSGIIKRHYIQPYALGHEIVHSWIGNWVFNRPDSGNWVEGLTTYLANYYYEELTGTADHAREQRRLMTLGYSIYVRPDEDYPISRFTHKTDQKDNAIGYQKTAMVFHMLRRELGEEAFWKGIRQLVSEHGSSYADWRDLERAFSSVSHADLRWFFAQWIEQAGAPMLAINDARIQEKTGAGQHSYELRLSLAQSGAPYRVMLSATIETADGQSLVIWLRLDAAEQAVIVPVQARPVSLQIDPNFDAFRRLGRREISPMLNLFVTDTQRSVLLPTHGTEAERGPYLELSTRLMAQDQQATVSVKPDDAGRLPASLLVLGGPDVNQAADWAVSGCHDQVSLEKDGATIQGHSYHGPNVAVLVSCPHPDHPDRTVTLFYGASPSAAVKVARLLFFYGWQSYLVFQDGTVMARGNFSPTTNSLRVTF